MKKNILAIFFILFFMLIIVSCGANPVRDISKVMDKVYLGMSTREFTQKVEGEELLILNKEMTIYRTNIKSYNHYAYGIPVLTQVNVRYFYFENDKLVKVDEGERATDFKIQIDTKKLNN